MNVLSFWDDGDDEEVGRRGKKEGGKHAYKWS